MHQRGVAADKIHAYRLCRPIQRQSQPEVALFVIAAADQRDRRDGNALVHDRDTIFVFDVLAGFYKILCKRRDFRIDFFAAAVNIRIDTIQQRNAHGDRPNVQMLGFDHFNDL